MTEINLYVQFYAKNEKISFKIKSNETIKNVEEKVKEQKKQIMNNPRFFFPGVSERLDKNKTLDHYKINNDNIIYMVTSDFIEDFVVLQFLNKK